MILLDTNVISEIMKAVPAPSVVKWFEKIEGDELFITSITIAEITYGINVLPAGERRKFLDNAFNKIIKNTFQYRILFFDDSSAKIYGKIMGKRKELGRPMNVFDGQIASIASAHGAVLATRNIKDFSHCDIDLVNPF